jgi:hypothetical protein
LPFGGNIEQRQLKSLAKELAAVIQFSESVAAMELSWSARKLWEEVYPKLSEGKPGLFGAVTARAEAQVRRIACLYALLDRSSNVQWPHLKAALAIWDYCDQSARYIFGHATGDRLADEILTELHKHGSDGVTRTDIRDLFQRNQSRHRIGAALALLEKWRLAERLTESAYKGRPTERWVPSRHTT